MTQRPWLGLPNLPGQVHHRRDLHPHGSGRRVRRGEAAQPGRAQQRGGPRLIVSALAVLPALQPPDVLAARPDRGSGWG